MRSTGKSLDPDGSKVGSKVKVLRKEVGVTFIMPWPKPESSGLDFVGLKKGYREHQAVEKAGGRTERQLLRELEPGLHFLNCRDRLGRHPESDPRDCPWSGHLYFSFHKSQRFKKVHKLKDVIEDQQEPWWASPMRPDPSYSIFD